jgi:hypothetical protein
VNNNNNNNNGRGRVRVDRFGHWHVVHGVLTFFTCGFWLPVWLIHFVIWSATRQ